MLAVLSASALGTAIVPAAAQAQDAAATKPADGNEIIVTAQKRAQNIQDVGVAITALGKNTMAAIGHQDITELVSYVPGLQVNDYSATLTVFNIRGVSQNDLSDAQEAPIAFYNDEVYVSSLGAISGQNFDLERVEVLRGPQGTLFGRNATGGLIQIVSAKPTKQLDGYATVTLGSYGQVATEAAIGGPLSEHVRARISVTTDDHGGYISNRDGPALGNGRFYGGRLQLVGDIGSTGTLSIKFQGLRNDHERGGGLYSWVAVGYDADGLGFKLAPNQNFFGNCAGCDALGYKEPDQNPYTGSFNDKSLFDRTYYSVTARYSQKIGEIDFVSITDYQNLRKEYAEDTDMTPMTAFNYLNSQNLNQVSEELRLSHSNMKFDWIAGAYGLRIFSRNGYEIDAPALGFLTTYGGTQLTQSLAAFGQGEYHFDPQLSMLLGARYSWDHKVDDFSAFTNGATDIVFNKQTYPGLASETFQNWSGKAQINYKPSAAALFYLGINRGTKSGGFGVLSIPPIDPTQIPYKQEVLTNLEGGVKLSLLDHRVTFNATGFHYWYHNYQAFAFVGLSEFIKNNDARISGAEFEGTARPNDHLRINAFVAYLNTKVFNITLPSGRVTDRLMPQSPTFSCGGDVRYEIPIGAAKAVISTDWKYNTSQYFAVFNAPIDREPPYAVGNVRVELHLPDSHWEAAVFVHNVADKWYRVYDLDLGAVLGDANQSFARPRWFGGSITYRIR